MGTLGHQLTALIAATATFAGPAWATVGISPPYTRLAVEPGGHGRGVVTVTNDSASGMQGTVVLEDWTIADGTAGSLAFHAPGTQVRSCTNDLQVVPLEFEVPPGGTQDLQLSVTLPEGASGSCFAALVVVTAPTGIVGAPEGMDLRIQLNLGHLVTVDAAGNTHWDATVGDLRIEEPTDVSPLVVRAHLVNDGDAGLRPETSFVVTDGHGAFVATSTSLPRYAQPGGETELVAEFDTLFAPGEYQVHGVIDIGGGQVLAPEARFAVEDRVALDAVDFADGDVVVWVDNGGDVTHTVTGSIDLEHDGAPASSHAVGPALVLPGQRVALRAHVGSLPPGAWTAVAHLTGASGPLEASGSIVVPTQPPTLERNPP